jgi:hypothetical protein
MVKAKAAVPDAWDDDWETLADREEDGGVKLNYWKGTRRRTRSCGKRRKMHSIHYLQEQTANCQTGKRQICRFIF